MHVMGFPFSRSPFPASPTYREKKRGVVGRVASIISTLTRLGEKTLRYSWLGLGVPSLVPVGELQVLDDVSQCRDECQLSSFVSFVGS